VGAKSGAVWWSDWGGVAMLHKKVTVIFKKLGVLRRVGLAEASGQS
jgi:hypothetical protein